MIEELPGCSNTERGVEVGNGSGKVQRLRIIEEDDRRLAIILGSLGGAYLFTLLLFPADFSPWVVSMMGTALVWVTESLPIALSCLVIIVLQALYGIHRLLTAWHASRPR